ncbi:MAG: hypothetical protein LVQ95_01485, partial [Candidatus Micrarchaeales archaeon]|nr:hypothetical protein [Candidatus Micrarchaeales archaeon]
MAIMDSKVVAGLLRARRAVPLLLLAVVLLNISFAGTAHSQSCSYPNSNIWINVDGATPPGPVNVQENSAGVATFTVNWGGSEPHGDNGVVFYLVQSSTPPDPCSSEASGNGYSIDAGSILPSGSMPFTWNIGNPASLTIWVAAVDISNNQATDWVQVNLLPAGSGNSGGSSGISANGIVAVVCGVYYAVSTMIFLLGLT